MPVVVTPKPRAPALDDEIPIRDDSSGVAFETQWKKQRNRRAQTTKNRVKDLSKQVAFLANTIEKMKKKNSETMKN